MLDIRYPCIMHIYIYVCVCYTYDIWFMYIWYILGIRDRGGYTIYQCEFLPWWWNAQRTFASAAPPWRFHPGVDLIMSLHGQKLLCLCTCSHTSYGIYIILHLHLASISATSHIHVRLQSDPWRPPPVFEWTGPPKAWLQNSGDGGWLVTGELGVIMVISHLWMG